MNDPRRRLDRRIELKRFELKCAALLASDASSSADNGWLISIFDSSAGTLLAVANDQRAARWRTEAERIRFELVELIIDRKLLDSRSA